METPNQLKLSFYFSSQLIKNILRQFIFLNIFFLFGTWLHNSLLLADKWYVIPRLVALLDLGKENNLAAWYSSMFLIIVSVAAFFCFLVDFQRIKHVRGQFLNLGWLVLVLIFLTLSFDEMGSFHEKIGETPLFKNVGGSKRAGWFIFYGLVACVGLFMVVFSFLKFKGNKLAFLFAAIGVILFLSNPFQEMYEMHSWRSSLDPSEWRRPIFLLILEEGTEIFASFCFLTSFILYSLNPEGKNKKGLLNRDFRINFNFNNTYLYVFSALIICAGLLMYKLRIYAWTIAGDNGIAHNWFPSAMGLFVALIASYLYFLSQDKSLPNKITLLLIISISLFSSSFYGCNIYDSVEMPLYYIPLPFLFTTILIGALAIVKLEGNKTKFSIAAWVLCIIIAIYNRWGFVTAMFGYMAFSFLFLSLVFYYQQIRLKLNRTGLN